MSAIALKRSPSFWLFNGTAAGVSANAAVVPQQHLNLFRDFANGSATGAEKIGGPVQVIDAVQAECSADNWNGEGAQRISPEAARWSKQLLLSLPSYLPAPDIYGDPTGAISFEWYRRPKHRIVLSIYDTGRVEFAGLLGTDDEVYGALRLGSGLPKVIGDHLRQLFAD